MNGVEKIVCVTQIGIDVSADTLIEEAEVKTEVVGCCGFPFYLRVVGLRCELKVFSGAHIVHVVRVVGHGVSGKMHIVTDAVLLTGLAD